MKKETFEDALPKSSNIYIQLWKAKQEIGSISKKSDNPFFKSKYADLNAILEVVETVLHKHGLVLLQPITDGCVSSVIIDTETQEMVSSEIALPNITDPQKLGSAVTYFRRYTIQALLSLQAVDDDANTATEAVKNQKPTIDQVRFDAGLAKVDSGEMTKEAFKKALSTFQLTDAQTKVIALL